MPLRTTRKEEYLAKAEDADREAGKAKDLTVRAAWKRIAHDYRALASVSGVFKLPP